MANLRRFLTVFRYKLGGRIGRVERSLRSAYYRLFYAIGRNVFIARGCRLHGTDIAIGDEVTLEWNTCLIGPVKLGSHIFINQQTIISSSVILEDYVGIGYKCLIFGDTREVTDNPDCRHGKGYEKTTVLERGAMIGARVTIMPGVRVGRGAVIAAGSLVTQDCEPNAMYAGSPAKKIRDLNPG